MKTTHFQPKNIILCSDGTGNTMAKNRGSNVWKLYEALDLSNDNENIQSGKSQKQLAFYDDGVGTESLKLLKILGGMSGLGLKRNVCELYASLCRAYRCSPEAEGETCDRIYLFGFSRGAYTVRTLAGLITSCGILKDANTMPNSELMEKIQKAYEVFRGHFRRFASGKQYEVSLEAIAASEQFRQEHSHDIGTAYSPPIEFIGVWDTVAAIGLPFDEITDLWNFLIYPFKFPDRKLHPQVKKACQALAIDDERRTFHPILWDEETPEDKKRIEQVWFPGMHSDVGGGYPRHGISLASLNWMIAQSQKAGLHFDSTIVQHYQVHENVHDKMHDSRTSLGSFYRYQPRDITSMCDKNHVQIKFHRSVNQRIALSTQGYAPGNVAFANLDNKPEDLQLPPEPMQSTRKLVRKRRRIYLFLLSSVALTVLTVIKADTWNIKQSLFVPETIYKGTEKLLAHIPIAGKALTSFFHVFYSNIWFALAVVAVAFFLSFTSRSIRRKQNNIYMNYWEGTREHLEKGT